MKTLILTGAAAALLSTAAYADMNGVWESADGDWALNVIDGGYLVPVDADMNVWAVASYTMDEGRMAVTDMSGPCGEAEGVYDVAHDGDVVTFTAVEDACEIRSETMNGLSLTKRADPDMEE